MTTGLKRRIYRAGARYLEKPDVEGLLEVKFPTYRSIVHAAMNEAAFRLGYDRGYRLTSVNVEVTNRCNLKCIECPTVDAMRRPQGLIDYALFEKILAENPQLEFMLLFQWGEPFLHPRVLDMVRACAARGVRTMLTSNGTLLGPERRREILESGLTRLTISIDGVGDTHTRIRRYPYERLRESVLTLVRERDALGRGPAIDVSMVVFDETEADVPAFRREWVGVVDRVQAIPMFVAGKRESACRELWRGTMVVLWDGRVTVCCADYDGALVVGDARKERLVDVWDGERMRALRRAHLESRFPGICAQCSEYRSAHVSPRFA
ncbi:MAG: radical SAM protein [Planctomycetes bacterium]|nr:radical SAM protein [Planctomycetota bacterium]MBI3845114.1 radical SAM protein [Planctomycetota bacterium]